ncbi:hypothetical protein [Laceyella putida]|uniref:Uncharacterized protein n=1 Tax=Laceyella putida TaxID=110101 RepID=A0ABW2RPS5_9BACL
MNRLQTFFKGLFLYQCDTLCPKRYPSLPCLVVGEWSIGIIGIIEERVAVQSKIRLCFFYGVEDHNDGWRRFHTVFLFALLVVMIPPGKDIFAYQRLLAVLVAKRMLS